MHDWGEKEAILGLCLTSPKTPHFSLPHYFLSFSYATLSSNKNYKSRSVLIHSHSLFAYLMEFYSHMFRSTPLPSLRGDLANGILPSACYCAPGGPLAICIAYRYL